MPYYTLLKARFIKQLELFSGGADRYHLKHASLLFLLDRHSLLADIEKKLSLVGKISESDRRLALTIYNETSAHIVPEESGVLVGFKKELL